MEVDPLVGLKHLAVGDDNAAATLAQLALKLVTSVQSAVARAERAEAALQHEREKTAILQNSARKVVQAYRQAKGAVRITKRSSVVLEYET